MPSCIRLGKSAQLTSFILVIFISACSQSPTKPVQVTDIPTQISYKNIGLTLNDAYKMMQTKTSTPHTSPRSSLFDFYQIQDQLAPQLSAFFNHQNAALALTETYWELAIVDSALQQIWLEQKKLTPTSSTKNTDQNLAAVSDTKLSQKGALASTNATITQYKHKVSQQLAHIIGSKNPKFSLNYLPLSELRQHLPEPNTLLINEFSKGILQQNYHSTYARLTSKHPKLKSLQIRNMFQQPVLSAYIWYEIASKINHQAALLPANTPNPQLALESHLTQLHIALGKYNHSFQKMLFIKSLYEAAQGLYQLNLEQLSTGNINQQEVDTLSIESMAIHLTYLQATLDAVHAYSNLLASSHLPPNTWHQPLESSSLAIKDYASMSNIINLSPASGADEKPENSDHLVSITSYSGNATDTSDQVTNLALLHYLKRPPQQTTIATVAQTYLWQIDLGKGTSTKNTKALLKQEPGLTYLLHYLPEAVGSGSSSNKLTAAGLGHSQARALCERLKVINAQCWLQQSEH
jgi:hypothetical protein